MGRRSPWKNLVRDLTQPPADHPYIDQVREVVSTPEQAQDSLEKEIIHEIAEALGRAGRKVEDALAALREAERALEEATTPARIVLRTRDYNELRQVAMRARHELQIHREAIGIRKRHELYERYAIPPRR